MDKRIGRSTMLRLQRAGQQVRGTLLGIKPPQQVQSTLLRLKSVCLKQLDDDSIDPVQKHRRQLEILGGTALGLTLILGFILFNAYAGSQHLKAGIAAINAGEARHAINELSACTSAPLAPVSAYEYRAIAYSMNGDYALSAADFSKVIAYKPNDATAYMGRACQRLKNLDYAKAIDDFNKVLKLQPDNTDAYRLRAAAEWKLKRLGAVASDCKTYLASKAEQPVEHRISVMILLASALHDLGQSQHAVEICQQAIALNKNDPRPYQKRARLYLQLEQIPKAIEDCTTAIKLAPSAQLYELRSSCYQAQGNSSAAMNDLDQAVKLASSDLKLRNSRAELAIAMREYDKALEDAKFTLAAAPSNRQANALFQKVRNLTGANKTIVIASSKFGGDSGSATIALPAAGAADSETVRGYRLLVAGKTGEAVSVLGAVITKNPSNSLARKYLAHALLASGHTAQASEQFAMLSSSGTLSAQDTLAIAKSAEETGDLKQSAANYEKYLSMNPADAETRLALVELYQRAGMTQQAIAAAHEGAKRARNPQEAGVFARAVMQASTAAN